MRPELDLVSIAKQLLIIHENFPYYVKHPETNRVDRFEMETFTQTWGNTSGGFEGIGGSAITTMRTYVFIPISASDEDCQVWFDGVYAYSVPMSEKFLNDVKARNVAGQKHYHKYLNNTKN